MQVIKLSTTCNALPERGQHDPSDYTMLQAEPQPRQIGAQADTDSKTPQYFPGDTISLEISADVQVDVLDALGFVQFGHEV
mmetsp:Transcript_107804/g.247021  ORF Transcript_107804/g.247021 Transcript_107804/m.247021 type:complete len:81 (-) Transcript_107804:120-362(-)